MRLKKSCNSRLQECRSRQKLFLRFEWSQSNVIWLSVLVMLSIANWLVNSCSNVGDLFNAAQKVKQYNVNKLPVKRNTICQINKIAPIHQRFIRQSCLLRYRFLKHRLFNLLAASPGGAKHNPFLQHRNKVKVANPTHHFQAVISKNIKEKSRLMAFFQTLA